ncbi:hypothetical protein MCEROE11_01162 [Candidatus Nanopelagicaceae bacterium]
MRKRLIALLVITPLLFSSQLSTSHAAAKAGAKCSKVGSKSVVGAKTFTCIKSGKKLVWDKGVSQSPGKNINAREQAYNSVRLIYNTNQGRLPKNKIQIISNSSIKQSVVSEVRNRTTNFLKFFGDEAASINFYIIIGNTETTAWMVQEFTKADPANAGGHAQWETWLKGNLNSSNRCKVWNAGSMGLLSDGSGLLQFTLYPNDCTNPLDIVWKTTVEHEVVGAMQRVWSERRDDLLPCWLNEGQQVYYGSVLGTAKNFSEFKEVFSWHKRFKKEDLMTAAKRLGYGVDGGTCGSQGGYEAGRLLVEQLIYQFGHEELISFTKAIVNTPGQDSEKWKVAFEKQFKISYDKWLENVVPEIEKREL